MHERNFFCLKGIWFHYAFYLHLILLAFKDIQLIFFSSSFSFYILTIFFFLKEKKRHVHVNFKTKINVHDLSRGLEMKFSAVTITYCIISFFGYYLIYVRSHSLIERKYFKTHTLTFIYLLWSKLVFSYHPILLLLVMVCWLRRSI